MRWAETPTPTITISLVRCLTCQRVYVLRQFDQEPPEVLGTLVDPVSVGALLYRLRERAACGEHECPDNDYRYWGPPRGP